MIVSFGHARVLRLGKFHCKMSSKGKFEWVKDLSLMKTIVMDGNNIIIVNSLVEIQHQHHSCGTVCKYRHGNVLVHGEDNMSFNLFFE